MYRYVYLISSMRSLLATTLSGETMKFIIFWIDNNVDQPKVLPYWFYGRDFTIWFDECRMMLIEQFSANHKVRKIKYLVMHRALTERWTSSNLIAFASNNIQMIHFMLLLFLSWSLKETKERFYSIKFIPDSNDLPFCTLN